MKVKAAGLFLVNKEDKILIGHPTGQSKSVWSIPKGKIDGDETPLEAAIRETYEESNVEVFKDLHDFVEIGKYVYRHKKKDIMIYAIFEPEHAHWDKLIIKCNSNVPEERGGFPEMDDFKWVTLDEARNLLHNTQVYALEVLQEKIDVHHDEVDGKYDMIWCDDCLDYVYHRQKLSAMMSGHQVCNRCSRMNPICTLIKETDNVESHFMKTSTEFKFIMLGDGTNTSMFNEPKVGRSLHMGPLNSSFTWLTTPITEIVSENYEKERKYIKFKTKNSTYEFYFHIT